MISSCIATAVPANSRTRTREALGCLIVCRFMPPVVGRRCNGLRFAAGSGRCGRRPLRLVPRDGTVSRTRVTFADEGEQVAVFDSGGKGDGVLVGVRVALCRSSREGSQLDLPVAAPAAPDAHLSIDLALAGTARHSGHRGAEACVSIAALVTHGLIVGGNESEGLPMPPRASAGG